MKIKQIILNKLDSIKNDCCLIKWKKLYDIISKTNDEKILLLTQYSIIVEKMAEIIKKNKNKVMIDKNKCQECIKNQKLYECLIKNKNILFKQAENSHVN